MQIEEVKRFGAHRNAFGVLRLLFASLVIVAHTPALIDGNRDREPLHRLFGTITFGELAVDCFFLVSGYLIVGSYQKNPAPWFFMQKRILRIYPAFIVASLVCILVVAPLGGAWLEPDQLVIAGLRLVTLQPAEVAGAFAGTHEAALNGSMWTIAYEFRCYLLVLGLGMAGAFRHVWLIAALAISAAAIELSGLGASLAQFTYKLPLYYYWLGDLHGMLRLVPIFLVGSIFYLCRDRIRFSRVGMAIAACLLTGCLFVDTLAEPGLAIFGGYLVFGAAQWGGDTVLSRINNEDDISYGLYLYAWPVEKLIFWFLPGFGLWAAGILTWMGAAFLGFTSWHLLEKPVMKRFARVRPAPRSLAASSA